MFTRLEFLKSVGAWLLAQRPGIPLGSGIISQDNSGCSDAAPTVNLSGWSTSTIEEDQSSSITITYSGSVTSYNLVSTEVEVVQTDGSATTNSFTKTILNGTTATATFLYSGASGHQDIKMRVLAGAVQNGCANNAISAWSANLTINSGGK